MPSADPDTFNERLAESHRAGTPMVLDGGVGTLLESAGIACPAPLWSAIALDQHQASLGGFHRLYASAGAEIVVANTFRTNPRALAAADRLADGPSLCRRAVEIVREAVVETERQTWIAGSVAPAADCYQPEAAPDDASLREEHSRFAEWLENARVDLLWLETMNSRREAEIATACAVETRLPVVVCLALREDGCLLSGDGLADTIQALEEHSPTAIGLNCMPPSGIDRFLPRLRDCTQLPLAAYAHIGNERPTPGWNFTEHKTPNEYASHARLWLQAGATIVGGCCGTTPEHIAAVTDVIQGGGNEGSG